MIRRAARVAVRSSGGDLLAVHIARGDGLSGSSVAVLDQQRLLVESLGGSYHSVLGDKIAESVLEFARANNATQIVIGASRRNPIFAAVTGPGTGMTIARISGSIDVHVVGHDYIGKGRILPQVSLGLTRQRRQLGLLAGLVQCATLVPICAWLRGQLTFGSDLLLFLLAVVICSLIGGVYPAIMTAVVAIVLLNFYFVPPIHKFTIAKPENFLSLVVFVVIAILVSRVVDRAARRTAEAARSNAEAETLSTLAGSVLRGEDAVPALLERVRETFAVSSVALLRREVAAPSSGRSGLRGDWSVVASVGEDYCRRPDDADTEAAIADDFTLALRGRTLAAEDRRLLAAFGTEVAVAYRQRQLAEQAGQANTLAQTDRSRTALLNAVSHDLRTPIASAKAAVSSLRSSEVLWSEDDRQELLCSADSALDRLTALVTNLLDLSRLQAGALSVSLHPVGLDDVVSRAMAMTAGAEQVELDVSAMLPEVIADPGLLERVIANLVENALRYAPSGQPVRVSASGHGDMVELRVIDRGPGIGQQDREGVFEAFQRRNDGAVSTSSGVGLGLAIARGFIDSMHGTITLDDTPGGGLMVTVALPEAAGTVPAGALTAAAALAPSVGPASVGPASLGHGVSG